MTAASPRAAEAGPAVVPAQAQHPGRRAEQEDACGFSRADDAAFVAHAGHLAVLADGMGGGPNGRWASAQAVQAFIEAYHAKSADEAIPDALRRALDAANRLVHEQAAQQNAVDRMGTTLVAAVVHDGHLHWLGVGDSRAYRFDPQLTPRLLQLTVDHRYGALLEERVARGELSTGEALAHPLRDALTSYLGRARVPQCDASTSPDPLGPGALVLLCSDGLTQALDDATLDALLDAVGPDAGPQAVCDRLLQAALARGLPDQDNVSLAVLQVPQPGQHFATGTATRAAPELPPARPAPRRQRAPRPPRRPWWRQPLAWGGVAAAGTALLLAGLARQPAPPSTGASPVADPRPSIDLLSLPAASAASAASASSTTSSRP